MTDITELAQREKFEAWWEREYKHLESSKYTDAVPHIKYGFWMAYQAGGAELVEALEKAQSRDVIQSAKDYHFDQQADRIAELDAELEREREKSRRVMSRIAELESRTVKLPDDEDGQAYGFGKWANGKLPATAGTMTIAYCEDAWRAAFEVFSSTAGIKVETE
ncbi:hypothetical protein PO498_24300 [Klebsiella variicola]|uniref:hypothetical protein n=1 Tax=Klebsiella variicola TaxID=244366 RepID=UPI002FF68707